MNFFEHQDRARRNTQKLVGLFILSVFCIIITVYGAALVSFGIISKGQSLRNCDSRTSVLLTASSLEIRRGLPRNGLGIPRRWPRNGLGIPGGFPGNGGKCVNTEGKTSLRLWQPQLFLWVAIPTILVIGCGSWYKLLELKQGGHAIAEDLGGRELLPETANPAEQQLLNVVEEMAIAAGISVPVVYVLDAEQGINAFAAGYTPNDAVIGITRGTLEQLNRDELQGVIGHEFSHILNGDMLLNLRSVGLLHGILMVYLIGRILCDWGPSWRSRDKNNGIVLFGLALIVIGSIGLLCGRLIKSAISRQREFLADASAVQFTRNPDGIAGALRKIANHDYSSLVRSPYAEENSHLFFGSALSFHFFGELFATHPPLEQRIRRLESRKAQSGVPKSPASPINQQQFAAKETPVMGLAATGTPSPTTAQIKANPDQVVAQVGTVAPEHFAYAQALLAQLPPSIQTGLRSRQNAIAIVYALALDAENPQVREQQITWLRQVELKEMVESMLEFYPEIAQFDPRMRLPLLDLTIPALRQSTATECQQLFKGVTGLAKADGQWTISEFVIYLVLWHRLQPCINSTVENKIQYTALNQIWSECLILLSALSKVGQTSQDAVTYAFRSGVYKLPGASQQTLPETPPSFNLGDLHKSLKCLGAAAPKLKQGIVDACAHTVLLDNVVTVQEADLLRAIAITLDCPLPPFLVNNRPNRVAL